MITVGAVFRERPVRGFRLACSVSFLFCLFGRPREPLSLGQGEGGPERPPQSWGLPLCGLLLFWFLFALSFRLPQIRNWVSSVSVVADCTALMGGVSSNPACVHSPVSVAQASPKVDSLAPYVDSCHRPCAAPTSGLRAAANCLA